ncbi:unnamed protein product [Heligmosomoides polygyrus]|uniref:Mcm10 domain-containing protein n=2 Tax=Heligmosomoides polygyrus TaxID=6339 RepID=A0A183GLL8_HELPZ|nr:unnamed protein product [Heligmosomoides polygyrus]
MDEVDVALYIEPLSDAIKDLREQFNLFTMSFNTKMDALVDILNRQSKVVNNKIDLILERTIPKSSCVFCAVDGNKDNHPTGRCCRFPDAVSRAVQAANLRLCNKCLQPRHADSSRIQCTYIL